MVVMAQKIGRNEQCPCGSGRKYKNCHGLPKPIARAQLNIDDAPVTDPPRHWKPYCELAQIEVERRREIEGIFGDEFAFIDDCLALAAKHVEMLGGIPPSSVEDVGMRDLSCNAFEFLYEARADIAKNIPSVVFPLMRRAFETISLCQLFMAKPEFARKWSKGRAISNSDVRKHLEHDPMTESVDQLRKDYNYFSKGTHPNRTHVPFLFLGEGNRFPLCGVPPIDPAELGRFVLHLVRLSYWYVGVFAYYYRTSLQRQGGPQFIAEFLKLTPRIKQIRSALEAHLTRLEEGLTARGKPEGIGPAFLNGEG
jgi:hypothetical protein